MKPRVLKTLRTSCIVIGVLLILLWMFYIIMLGPPISADLGSVVVMASTPSSSAPQDVAYAEQMRKFLETNGGCELPCFLGIRAGETSLESVKEKYRTALDATFQYTTGPKPFMTPESPDYEYDLYLSDRAHGLQFHLFLLVEPEYDSGNGTIISFSAGTETWQRGADSYYAQVMEHYLLPAMLRDMGIPDQVWVRAAGDIRPDSYTGMPAYTLILYYFEQRLRVEYRGDLEEKGDRLLLCPSKGTVLSEISQWWPKERETAETVIADSPSFFLIQLEQATGVNIMTFYEMFKDPGSQACLETPTQMWEYSALLTRSAPYMATQTTTPTP